MTQTQSGSLLLTDTATGHAWIGLKRQDGSFLWNSVGSPPEAK
jgi:hypothetical protein